MFNSNKKNKTTNKTTVKAQGKGFMPTPWSHPSSLVVAPTCSCPLIHFHSLVTPIWPCCSHLFMPTHSHPLIHTHSFTPAPWSHPSGLVAPTCLCPLFTLTWSSAGFCSAPLLGHTLCWFLLIPATWSDLSGLHSCPFQPVCLYQIHS